MPSHAKFTERSRQQLALESTLNSFGRERGSAKAVSQGNTFNELTQDSVCIYKLQECCITTSIMLQLCFPTTTSDPNNSTDLDCLRGSQEIESSRHKDRQVGILEHVRFSQLLIKPRDRTTTSIKTTQLTARCLTNHLQATEVPSSHRPRKT